MPSQQVKSKASAACGAIAEGSRESQTDAREGATNVIGMLSDEDVRDPKQWRVKYGAETSEPQKETTPPAPSLKLRFTPTAATLPNRPPHLPYQCHILVLSSVIAVRHIPAFIHALSAQIKHKESRSKSARLTLPAQPVPV